ncbi:MAG: endonuclease III [Candidatus Paceibacterota bacterium]
MTEKKLEERKKKARRLVDALKKVCPDAGMTLHFRTNWELLVAVMLSAQCTDKKVNEVTRRLFSAKGGPASGGKKFRTIDDFVNARQEHLEKIIKPCGFYHTKARNIKKSARIIQETYNGRVPKTMEELVTLPGVARKTANVVLGNAYGVISGIAVDTHVMRLSRRFGLTNKKTPEQIERDLMEIIPQKEWFHLTSLFIEYGRRYCPARGCPREHPLWRFDLSSGS